MKNIIVLIVGLLLVLSSTVAQIVKDEPQQKRFLFNDKDNTDSTTLNADDPYFQSDEFILGWHWAGTNKISRALRANQQDIGSWLFDNMIYNPVTYTNDTIPDEALSHVNPGFLLTTQPPHWTHCLGPNPSDSRAIQFEPTLLIDTFDPFDLKTNQDGSQVPFGFRNIDSRTSVKSYQDQNYNSLRLYIDKDSIPLANPGNPIKILSEPWPSDEWYMFLSRFPVLNSLITGKHRTKYYNDFMCKTLYVSIKLRITDSLEIPGDEILKVEVPCLYAYKQSGIIHDSLLFKPYIKIEPKEIYEPDISTLDLSLDTSSHDFYRNYIINNSACLEINPSRTPYQNTQFIDSIDQKQYIIIKRDMLPPSMGDEVVITFAIVFEEERNHKPFDIFDPPPSTIIKFR